METEDKISLLDNQWFLVTLIQIEFSQTVAAYYYFCRVINKYDMVFVFQHLLIIWFYATPNWQNKIQHICICKRISHLIFICIQSEEVLSIIWNTFSIWNGKNFAICKWKKIILKAQKNSNFSTSSRVLSYTLVLKSGIFIQILVIFMLTSESLQKR